MPPKSNTPLTIPRPTHKGGSPPFSKSTSAMPSHFIYLHAAYEKQRMPICAAASRLHNHRRWEDTLQTPPHPDQLPCGCSHLRQLLHSDHPEEHLIVTLEDLQLPPHLHRFLNANMNSAFFPTKRQYFDTFRSATIRWLKHHGLPTTLVIHADNFLTTQWQHHLQRLHQEDRFTARSVKQLRQFLGVYIHYTRLFQTLRG